MIHWVLLRLSGVDRKKDAARVFVTPTPWDRPATGADWRRQGGGHEACPDLRLGNALPWHIQPPQFLNEKSNVRRMG